MKKYVLLVTVVYSLTACSNNGNVKLHTDSLRQRLDTTLEKVGDSAKAKGQRALEELKDKVNNIEIRTDSDRSDTTK